VDTVKLDGKGRATINLQLPPELVARLRQAAAERAVSVHLLAAKGLEDFLVRLVPVDEIKWTRDR